MLKAQRKLDEAIKAYRNALAIRERLAAADRSNATWQRDLGVGHYDIASIHEQLGRIADALQEMTKARDAQAALVAFAPGNAQWKEELAMLEEQMVRLQGRARMR
jgi:tetratricopeptide (TPR) repeat protein